MSDPDDIAAIRHGLLRGDHAALSALYDRSAAGLHRCLRGLLGSASAADEALQDVFTAIARRPARVADALDIDAYVARMARNRAHDHLRRQQRENSSRQQAHSPGALSPPDDDSVTAESVAEALAALPLDQREVVVLKLWQGLTFAQIASAVGANANTVASRYRYALDKLRVLLEELRHADR